MKTILNSSKQFADAIRDCVTAVLGHYGKRYRSNLDNEGGALFVTQTEKILGFEKDGYAATIGATETNNVAIALLQYYFFYYSDPTNLHFADLETHRRLILIGILNACWIQRNAMNSLFHIFKMESSNLLVARIENTEAIKSRNKIASHNANFVFDGNKKNYYHFNWVDEKEFSYFSTGKVKDVSEQDLKNELQTFSEIINESLLAVLGKVIDIIRHASIAKDVKKECEEIYKKGLRTTTDGLIVA